MGAPQESYKEWRARTRPAGENRSRLDRIGISNQLVFAAVALVFGSRGFALFFAMVAGCLAVVSVAQRFATARPDIWAWLSPAIRASVMTVSLVVVFANDATRKHWWIYIALLLGSLALEFGLSRRGERPQ